MYTTAVERWIYNSHFTQETEAQHKKENPEVDVRHVGNAGKEA